MLLKSKSTRIIILISLGVLALFLVLGIVIHRNSAHTFDGEGYILDYTLEAEEEKSSSEQLWFGAGEKWSVSALDTVSFKDIQKTQIHTEEDSFVHYTDGSLAAFSESVLSDMDEYETGHIQHYNMPEGLKLAENGEYQYVLMLGDREVEIANLFWKAGGLSYLAGSSMIQVHFGDGSDEYVSSGYVEVRYLDDELNAVILSDGVSAWQVLSQGAYIRLENGVTMDLSTGNLFRSEKDYEKMQDILAGKSLEDAPVYVNVQDDFIIGSAENTVVYNPAQIPKFHFNVVNGEDGADGADGNDGVEGEAGAAGDSGQEGAAGEEGAEGSTNSGTGANGTAGYDGSDSTVSADDSSSVQNELPAVKVRSWSLNGKSLMFNLSVDDNQVQYFTSLGADGEDDPDSTRVSLIDADTGKEVYYWTKEGCFSPEDPDNPILDDRIDLTVINSDGWPLVSPELELNKTYRLVVKANYQLNGVTGTQTFLDRSFTTDSYGINAELVSRTDHSLSVALKQDNERVKIQSVSRVSISGDGLPTQEVSGEYKPGDKPTLMIDMGGNDFVPDGAVDTTAYGPVYTDVDANFANRYYDITYELLLEVSTYDENGQLSVEKDIPYTVTCRYKTLKSAPVVGGINLTPYNEGYFEAKLYGKHNGEVLKDDGGKIYQIKYDDVFDPDGAIVSAIFNLYEVVDGKKGSLVASEHADAGNVAYFVTDEIAGFSSEKTYRVEAVYTYDDDEKTIELPALESYDAKAGETYEDVLKKNHSMKMGEAAWAQAQMGYIFDSNVKFVGAKEWHNTATDTTKGTLYNAIHGSLLINFADYAKENVYYSNDYPLELSISGAPDYNKMLQFYSGSTEADGTLLMSCEPAASTVTAPVSSEGKNIRIDLDQMSMKLNGLRAGTAYTFTIYGYVSDNGGGYVRSVLGSTVVRTDSDKNIDLAMRLTEGTGPDSLGLDFVLGTDSYDKIVGANKVDAPSDADSADMNSDYMQKIGTAYRSLAGINFYLYKENAEGSISRIGYCEITDDDLTNPETNKLYEAFYGDNAGNTYRDLISDAAGNLSGMVGVGDKFLYRFRNVEDNKELLASDLTSGNYYITAELAYDYTYYRTQRVNRRDYDYYAYNYSDDSYINYLTVNGKGEMAGADAVEIRANDSRNSVRKYVQATPYLLPEVVREASEGGIKATLVTNAEAGKADVLPEALRDDRLENGTSVGIRLNTSYINDPQYYTESLTYYGFDREDYDQVEDGAELTPDTDYRYKLKYTIDMRDREAVPEIWILNYDASEGSAEAALLKEYAENPTSEDVPENMTVNKAAAGDMGYDYWADVLFENGKRVRILYAPEPKEDSGAGFTFGRGNSYVFSFETTLNKTYKWSHQGESEVQKEQFVYPNDHYLAYTTESEIAEAVAEAVAQWEADGLSEDEIAEKRKELIKTLSVSKEYALKSEVRTLPRQVPVIYASLENTYNTTDEKCGGRDQWDIYINDPDGAILPESLHGGTEKDCYYNSQSGIMGDNYAPLTGPTGTKEGEDFYLVLKNGSAGNGAVIQSNGTYFERDQKDAIVTDPEGNPVPDPDAKANAEQFIRNITGQKASVYVDHLSDAGLYYQVRLAYRLDDDQPEIGNLTLMEHDYIGLHDYQDYNAAGNQLEVEQYLQEDHDLVNCYIGTTAGVKAAAKQGCGSDDDSENNEDSRTQVREYYRSRYYTDSIYTDFIKSIAGIQVTAEVRTPEEKAADKPFRPIVERDKDGELTTIPKSIWTVPSPAVQGDPKNYTERYLFSFRISDLDVLTDEAIENGKTPQYSAGDELRITYSFRYTTGNGLRSWDGKNGAVEWEEDYSTAFYAVKYVGSNRYMVLTDNQNASVSTVETDNAARSLLNIKLKTQTEEFPWFQNLAIRSDIFCQNPQRSWRLSGDDAGTNGNELLGEYHNYSAGSLARMPIYEMLGLNNVEVKGLENIMLQSIAPSLQNAGSMEGIMKAGFSGYIRNYNMIEMGQGEDAHLYYLIYDETEGTPSLAGAGIGENLKAVKGQLDRTWEIGKDKNYRLYLYYKYAKIGETVPKDADIFGSLAAGDGKEHMYWTADGDGNAQAIETAIINGPYKDNFAKVVNSASGITLKTDSNLHLTFGNTGLGYQGEYFGKKLASSVSVAENVNDEEQSRLKLVYTLERCILSRDVSISDETQWHTVLYDECLLDDEKAELRWEEPGGPTDINTWSYYRKDLEVPETVKTGGPWNSYGFHYLPGGFVRPGYVYRMTARIYYREESGSYVNVTAADEKNEDRRYMMSQILPWPQKEADDAQAMASILQLRSAAGIEEDKGKSIHYIDFTFNYRDDSYTSPSQTYYIRLIKKEKGTGAETVVEDSRYYPLLEGTQDSRKAEYQMMLPYTKYRFAGLDADTEYKIQLYAATDFDYDGYLNINENGKLSINSTTEQIFDPSAYYAADYTGKAEELSNYEKILKDFTDLPDSLRRSGDTDGSTAGKLLIAESEYVKTLEEGQTFNVGTYIGTYTITEKTDTTEIMDDGNLELSFKGSFNCDNPDTPVHYFTWSLAPVESGVQTYQNSGSYGITSGSLFGYDKATERITLYLPNVKYTDSQGVTTNLLSFKGSYRLILSFYAADDQEGAAELTPQTVTIDLNF